MTSATPDFPQTPAPADLNSGNLSAPLTGTETPSTAFPENALEAIRRLGCSIIPCDVRDKGPYGLNARNKALDGALAAHRKQTGEPKARLPKDERARIKREYPMQGIYSKINTESGVLALIAKGVWVQSVGMQCEYPADANYGICSDWRYSVLETDNRDELVKRLGQPIPSTFFVSARDSHNRGYWIFEQTDKTRLIKGLPEVPGLFEWRQSGYCVGFGSIHPTGTKYRVVCDVSPIPFPDWLADALLEMDKNKPPSIGSIEGEDEPDAGVLETLFAALHKRGEPKDMLGIEGLVIDSEHPTLKHLIAHLYQGKETSPDVAAIVREVGEEYGWREPEEKDVEDVVDWFDRHDKKPCYCELCEEPLCVLENAYSDGLFVFKKEIDCLLHKAGVPPYPSEALEGDAISDFMHAVCDGTGLPPQFVRSVLSSAVELALDHRIGYPSHENLRMRPYVIHVTQEPRTGKGESYQRTFGSSGLARKLLGSAGEMGAIELLEGTNCGSGQFAVKKIADLQERRDRELLAKEARRASPRPDDPRPEDIPFSGELDINSDADISRLLTRFGLVSERDEEKRLGSSESVQKSAWKRDKKKVRSARDKELQKMREVAPLRKPQPEDDYLRVWLIHDELRNAYKGGDTSTEELLLSSYERNSVAHGSYKNGEHSVENVSLAFHGDAVRSSFNEVFTGRPSGNSGFLARCKLCFAVKNHLKEWREMDAAKAIEAVQSLSARVAALPKSQIGNIGGIGGNAVFVPAETDEARRLREEFLGWLYKQNGTLIAELDSHFKRDVLVRVVASGAKDITAEHINRAAAWTRYQLSLREALYPADHEDPVARACSKMIELLKKDPARTQTDRDFSRYLHVNQRNHPSSEQYMRARKSLLGTGQIKIFGMNRKRSFLYQLEDRSNLPLVLVSADDAQRWKEHRDKRTGAATHGEKESQEDTK